MSPLGIVLKGEDLPEGCRGCLGNRGTARGEKRLICWPRQANFTSEGKPLGLCRLMRKTVASEDVKILG